MTNQTPQPDVRSYVREHYGQIAENFQIQRSLLRLRHRLEQLLWLQRSASQGEGIGVDKLYNIPEVNELPEDVTGLSLGCGDPVTLASLKPGQIVLDLGSGGGIDCFLAAKKVGPTGRVIGVDMTPAMLEKARAQPRQSGAGQCRVPPGRDRAPAGGRQHRGCDHLQLRDQPQPRQATGLPRGFPGLETRREAGGQRYRHRRPAAGSGQEKLELLGGVCSGRAGCEGLPGCHPGCRLHRCRAHPGLPAAVRRWKMQPNSWAKRSTSARFREIRSTKAVFSAKIKARKPENN